MTLASEHFDMIEECEVNEDRLTDWERNFLDSLTHWLGSGKQLSIKQKAILTRTRNKVTKEEWL